MQRVHQERLQLIHYLESKEARWSEKIWLPVVRLAHWWALKRDPPIATWLRRHRKNETFNIRFGWYTGASEEEMEAWREICVDYINGDRNDFPRTLEAFRKGYKADGG